MCRLNNLFPVQNNGRLFRHESCPLFPCAIFWTRKQDNRRQIAATEFEATFDHYVRCRLKFKRSLSATRLTASGLEIELALVDWDEEFGAAIVTNYLFRFLCQDCVPGLELGVFQLLI